MHTSHQCIYSSHSVYIGPPRFQVQIPCQCRHQQCTGSIPLLCSRISPPYMVTLQCFVIHPAYFTAETSIHTRPAIILLATLIPIERKYASDARERHCLEYHNRIPRLCPKTSWQLPCLVIHYLIIPCLTTNKCC